MSYYIIPKIHDCIYLDPKYVDTEPSEPYISNSLLQYYKELREEIELFFKTFHSETNAFKSYKEICRIINPYEYIFTKIPGLKISVSKLKTVSRLFYDLFEVSNTLNVFDNYTNKPMKTLHITQQNNNVTECLKLVREGLNDDITSYDDLNDDVFSELTNNKFDFVFFDTNRENYKSYVTSLMKCLMIIFRNQELDGVCILKIGRLFHRPLIDVLYLLASLYSKVYIIKPNTSNISSFDKYIVCKKFQYTEHKASCFKYNYYKLLVFLKKIDERYVDTLFNTKIPYYFISKIEDLNVNLGQQQIDTLELIVNILKSKNCEEKIENIKKTNVQKSVAWCEKYKIPFNILYEKTNMFLPVVKALDV